MRNLVLIGAIATVLAACSETAEPAAGPDVASVAVSGVPDGAKSLESRPFNPLGQPVLIEPMRAGQTEIIEAGQPVQRYWASLPQSDVRRELDLTETVIQVERVGRSGSITPAFGSVSVSKGTYRVSFLYMQYKNQACGAGGTVRVGVGMEVRAVVETDARKLTLSSLLPLVAAAEDNKVSGSLLVRTIGITSGSSVLSGYVGQNLQLTTESLVKAMESLAVVRAVLESSDANLSPNFLAVNGGETGRSCLNLLPSAKLIGSQRSLEAQLSPPTT